MSIPIPYAMSYTSKRTGYAYKKVHCEHCGSEYGYKLERTAEGKGTSWLFLENYDAAERSVDSAERGLRRMLKQGVDLVPCPQCGWYQENMIPKARRLNRRWLLNAGACVAIGSIPVGLAGGMLNVAGPNKPTIPWPVFGLCVGALVMSGLVMMVVRYVLARSYDPNSEDLERRKQVGQSRAITEEVYVTFLKSVQGNDANRPDDPLAPYLKKRRP